MAFDLLCLQHKRRLIHKNSQKYALYVALPTLFGGYELGGRGVGFTGFWRYRTPPVPALTAT